MKKAKHNKRLAVIEVKFSGEWGWWAPAGRGMYFCDLRDFFEIPKTHEAGALVLNSLPHPHGYKVEFDGRDWRWYGSEDDGIFYQEVDNWLSDVLGGAGVGWLTFES